MFNPTPQRAAPQAWSPNSVLHPVRSSDPEFANTDWDQVPRLDYRTEKFRQLAVPDPARVVDDPSEFEPWKPVQIGKTPSAEATQADSNVSAHSNSQEAADPSASAQSERSASPKPGEDTERDASDAPVEAERHGDAPTDEPHATAPDASVHPDDASGTEPSTEGGESPSANAQTAGDTLADDTSESASGDESRHDSSTASEDRTPEAEPGLDSAAVQEACDAARQTGLDEGLEQGRAQGREEAQAQAQEALNAALEQAEADKAEALRALREELTAEIDPVKGQLNKATEQIKSLVAQPDKLYEHVKRLSLHLAEQLVLGELNLSSVAIERLIQRSLDELDLHGKHVVTVELNPQDKARLQERAGELSDGLSLQAVSSMQPGSVRVMINDTMVEDLVGNRLDALARSLLVQPEVWREQSPFFRQPLAQRDTEVQDAPARVVAPRDAAPAPKVDAATPSVIDTHDDLDEVDEVDEVVELGVDPQHDDNLDLTPLADPVEPADPRGEAHD